MRATTKNKVLLLCFICWLILVLTGCSALLEPPAEETAGTEGRVVSRQEQQLDEQIFPKDQVVDVRIAIDPADFQDMLDNAAQEQYKQASVAYNGIVYDNVAIRTKGNLSLNSVVSSDSDRYSFKIAFDAFISSQSAFGVTKINLNNGYSDASYMREFLAYELAESMGLPTPKYSFVNVYVNDELWGFYLAVEQIGEAYLDRHFDTSNGLLYKAVQFGNGGDLTLLDSVADYTALVLKSGANSGGGQALLEMLTELNTGMDYAKYLDVDEILSYIALNVAADNMDSYLGQNKHNYYLYEDNGVFSILPWDYNMAFGGMGNMGIGGRGANGGMGRNRNGEEARDLPDMSAAPDMGNMGGMGGMMPEADAGMSGSLLIDEPTQGALADRPLIARLLAVDEYLERYHEILREVAEGYLAEETFSVRVAELSAMIDDYVRQDPTAFYTYEQYEAGLASLIAGNTAQVHLIKQQLDGTLPSAGDGSGSGGGFGGGRGGQFGGAPGNGGPNGADQAPGGFGEWPADGQPGEFGGGEGFPDRVMGEPPAGQDRANRGGQPGGAPGDLRGMWQSAASANQVNAPEGELIATLSAIGILGFACMFILFYRRRRI